MADVIAEEKKEIQPNTEYVFTYEVIWKESALEFSKRSVFQFLACKKW